MNITAEDGKKFRQSTGAGIMDCKNALKESNGDIEKAIEYLRKKGIAKAEKNIAKLVDMGKPEEIDQGLSRLVLTVVTLLKRLMEREALRRMQGGTLANIEVEKLGLAFMAMEKKLEELKLIFGLRDEDLNITLGPLGNVM